MIFQVFYKNGKVWELNAEINAFIQEKEKDGYSLFDKTVDVGFSRIAGEYRHTVDNLPHVTITVWMKKKELI